MNDKAAASPPLKIVKPKSSAMEKYKSKRPPNAGVETAPSVLKIMKIAEVGDFVRVHPNEEECWTCELCFVDVPVKGERNPILHLIDEDIAMAHLEEKQIKRMRLALAAKPNGVFFFCIVPSQNLENSFNKSALDVIDKARTEWWQAISRKKEGHDLYVGKRARDQDFVPAPEWPTLDVWELLAITFLGFEINTEDHPGLLRLIGARQNLK